MDVPLVSGGAVRAEGTVGVYGLPIESTAGEVQETRGPCYACIFPPPPPSSADKSSQTQLERDLDAQRKSLAGTGACSDEGVLGINCGIVGIGMAAEAVKVILGIGEQFLLLFL
jgi:adenylyltransferase/sulfurtransferase